jgi:hypothetical protein
VNTRSIVMYIYIWFSCLSQFVTLCDFSTKQLIMNLWCPNNMRGLDWEMLCRGEGPTLGAFQI